MYVFDKHVINVYLKCKDRNCKGRIICETEIIENINNLGYNVKPWTKKIILINPKLSSLLSIYFFRKRSQFSIIRA